jgi:hypothetical protein
MFLSYAVRDAVMLWARGVPGAAAFWPRLVPRAGMVGAQSKFIVRIQAQFPSILRFRRLAPS